MIKLKIYLCASIICVSSSSLHATNSESQLSNPNTSYESNQQNLVRQSGVSNKEYQKYEKYAEHYINSLIKKSIQNRNSFSWLFDNTIENNYKENYFRPASIKLEHAIETLGSSFFRDLYEIKESSSSTISTYKTFLEENGFVDVSALQHNSPHQYAFIHKLGLVVRLKADPEKPDSELDISIYKKKIKINNTFVNSYEVFENYLNEPNSEEKIQQLKDLLKKKQGAESCKLYLKVIDNKAIVEPVPSAPYAVLPPKTIFRGNPDGLNVNKLSNDQHEILKQYIIDLVMALGHLKARVKFDD